MFLPQGLQNRLVEPIPMRQRRVRFNHDIAILKPLHDLRSIQPWVQLVLPNVDLASALAALDILLQFIEVMDAVVRYADGACLARRLRLD